MVLKYKVNEKDVRYTYRKSETKNFKKWKHPIMFQNLQQDTIVTFDIRVSENIRFTNNILIPVYDRKYNLVGTFIKILKPRFPNDRKYFSNFEFNYKNHHYNIHRIKLEQDYIIISEGLSAVWLLYEFGITNVISTFGTQLSLNNKLFIQDCFRKFKKVFLIKDNDYSGDKMLGEIKNINQNIININYDAIDFKDLTGHEIERTIKKYI